MKLNNLIERGDPEKLAGDFQFVEGPVWQADGSLLFSDIPANRIYRWTADGGAQVWREPTGNSNGLTLDREGRLIACEHSGRRVSRTEADGTVTAIASHFPSAGSGDVLSLSKGHPNGGRLNSPNDVVVKSDGVVYFTDPPYGIKPEEREQPVNGVYRILNDGTLELLVEDFDRPNGLAFSPDESILYIDDSPRRHVRAFDVRPDGTLTNSRIIADMDHPQPGSPDGMKIDKEGHLYVTGATGVWVFEPNGELLGVVVTPERPANCAWGDDDRCSLYITARTSLYRVRTKVGGHKV
ncbi:MAG: SMP-30/gluconolactonase/LRE family protein [Caldilineaceae bacterium]|nr:SMP-30/gluconolactonase/LRE family protein [Caldilineaceae bacterium]